MAMSKVSLAIGGLLIVFGLVMYFATGMASPTALIPAFVGLPVAVLGFIAMKNPDSDKVRMHTMHFAVMLTLIGALGGVFMGFKRLGVEGKEAVVIGTFGMAVLCVVHVVLGVRSFIAARKARQAGEGTA